MSKRPIGIPEQQNYNELLRQNKRQQETIQQLEQLCRDLWIDSCTAWESEGWAISEELQQRMDAFGLLEGMSDEKDLTCETCDECVYLGEGDFACMERDYELVIADWLPQRLPCGNWTKGGGEWTRLEKNGR